MSESWAIWDCKIGEVDRAKLPPGADAPMRQAVEAVYRELTGEEPRFIFSGWGGELTDIEREVADFPQADAQTVTFGDTP